MAKNELVRKDINLTEGGINLILKMMQETGLGVQGSLVKLQKRLDAFRKANPDKVRDLNRYITKAFPDGIEGIEKSLTESKVYEQFLYDSGYLKDADPDGKMLEDEIGGRDRRSAQGRKLLDIKEKGGVPVISGRNADGSPLEDKERTRPYKLVIGDKGIEEAKKVSLPIYVQTELTPQIEMQSKQRQAVAQREARVPAPIETPAIRGGESVEPHGGASSRRATGAVISRRDANTFKEAMGKAMEAPSEGKTNLFKRIVEEARKIDPRVSVGDMQNIKDYLYFRGVLEADSTISDKVGPSRISDVDVPEYVKPSAKYYKDGLAILDAGGSNEPLVIGKLSAEASPYVEPVKRETLDELIGSGKYPEKKETPSRLLDIIKRGGRGAAKALPFVAVADILTSSDPVAAATGSTPTARSALSEIKEDRATEENKRLRSADEQAFSAMEKEEATKFLRGSRGFLSMD